MSKPKTVKVRIAVAVGRDGGWYASGWPDANGGDKDCALDGLNEASYMSGRAIRWVTAEIPLPTEDEIKGRVEIES